ncbi:fimbrial protein [Citrobacter sp. BDA59-3]|uniref:fimbrial protein n=1 Tax=Citrobacter sp. BDA59-3 TaxID=2781952 RepID=UPI001880F603|nr:fimbrial protein [Citrobacter sp. BDA59-3]QOV69997.1 type 1 fimbrial protein [Citrobacter sp. BDA59-3]
MKKVLLAASIASALSLFNVAQAASSGTIDFNGEITDATCDVVLNGGTSASGTVTLPTISKSLLSAAAGTTKTAGQTRFTLDAKNCVLGTSGKTKVQAFFKSSAANVDTTSGYLLNKTGTAKDVQLRLSYFTTGNIIDVNSNALASGSAEFVTITSGNTATMPFSVEYITNNNGTGANALTSGTVKGQVEYELQYD